jgi:hypothetical protein
MLNFVGKEKTNWKIADNSRGIADTSLKVIDKTLVTE